MKPGSMRDWLGPTLGAALLVAGIAGLAYKVISGYRPPAPESFISVQDQNQLRAASTADHPLEAPTRTAPITAAPPVEGSRDWDSASGAAANMDARAEAQVNPMCSAIKTEQHEIEDAFHKTHSSEEGRNLQRRLVELTEQSVKSHCVE